MSAIITKTEFNHDDKFFADECSLALRDWLGYQAENIDGQDLLQAINVIGDKLTQDQCPSHMSHGWKQATGAFTTIVSLAEKYTLEGKLQRDEFHSALLKTLAKFFQDGPATVQMRIIVLSIPYIKDYTKSLQVKDMKDILEVACSPLRIKEDTPEKKVYEIFKLGLTDFIKNAFEVQQLHEKEVLEVMFNFVFHTYLDYSHLDKACYDHIISAGYQIYNYLKNAWKSYDDVANIKQFIQRINTAVKQPGFPQNKGVEVNVRQLFVLIRDITRKPGYTEECCNDIFDLLESVSQCQTEEVELLFDLFSTVFSFMSRLAREHQEDNPKLFIVILPRFKSLLEVIDIQFLIHTRFAPDIVDVLENAMAKNKNLVPQWVTLIEPLLRHTCVYTMRAGKSVFYKDEMIKWKEHHDVTDKIFEVLYSVEIPGHGDNAKEFCENLTSFATYFLRGLKRARMLKDYGEKFMLYSIKLLEMENPLLFDMAEDFAENIEINVKAKKESVMHVIRRLFVLIKNEDLPWLSNRRLYRAVEDLLDSTLHSVSDGKIFSDEDMRLLVDICATCLSYDAISPMDSVISPYYLAAIKILHKLIAWLGSTKRLGMASKLIPLFIKTYDEDDENLFQLNSRFLTEMGQFEPAIFTPYLGQFIKLFLDKEDASILHPVSLVYPKNPQPFKEHFQEMLSHLLDNSNPIAMIWLCQIFCEASKKQPELFTDENLEALVNLAINGSTQQATLLQILQELSKRKPEKMTRNLDSIINCTEWNPLFSSLLNDIVCSLALNVKPVANKVINYLLESIRTNQEKANVLTAYNAIRLIGFKYPDILKPKRQEIQQIQIFDPDGQNIKQTILDMIDGKTSNELEKQLKEQQETLIGLVDKVDEVEVVVVSIGDEISKQGEQLQNVTNELNEHDQRLDQVEETVEETATKVEEIDGKTLSHAPYWSRDVSKILNPQVKHDWRLLSSRLGYSNDDIRGWAQQADPCMAMLNEWYAVRKTSEATLAVLTHLQEMDRMDAAIIVENAMKNADAVVEDEEFEYASPPPIFISYQWGHQEEVKLLKKHLEMAGYECWMDIGQMGGGDKLFEKIDNGIRAAKVVISCISNKYTKSPNCNREVNLSVGLHKPLIPLLLEQCPWPPPGSMGPIFSESLFIRFFQRNGEETTDQRYWPEPKFLELLMQLNMNRVPPDEGKIEPVYKNWWMPIEEEIKIDKNKTKNGGKANFNKTNDADQSTESPEVFISYQWGKQKNVIKLYQCLTGLGFSCWLDIKEMGGGDSLYDKIDRGIRGSKVVLSCVTQKYSLSANCRREVSLADALKKPLIPLLLEKMTWPPSGPMSMVMTQLLYIGFTEESQQTSWDGPQFNELLSKIHQHIPNTVNVPSQDETTKKKDDDDKEKTDDKGLKTCITFEQAAQTKDDSHNSMTLKEADDSVPKPKAFAKPTPSESATPVVKPTSSESAKPVVKPTPSESAKLVVKPTPSESATPIVKPTPSESATPVVKPTPSESATPVVKPALDQSAAPQSLTPQPMQEKSGKEKTSKTCSII